MVLVRHKLIRNYIIHGGQDPADQERAATVSFVIHGSYRLLQEWINQEERLPPDAQTALMLHLAHRTCR